jgi:hypothetical protein|tara:strand:+ start:137 stop:526 length:390 start_codon:yes stop_codon:yes gene_type:complete
MTDNNKKKLKFPYSLDTKEKKEKYIGNRKRIVVIGTFLLVFGFALSFLSQLESFSRIIFNIGFYIIMIFYFIFWIENLVVMFRVGRVGYGFASIFIQVIFLFFFFIEFLPFLEDEKTIEEIEGKKKEIK